MNKLVRSTVGLRDALFEEWEAMREGDSNPARARSIAMMANTILQSVQVEIEYHKYVADVKGGGGDKQDIPLSATQMQLGNAGAAAVPPTQQ